MAILLTMQESSDEVLSGFPEYVEFSTSTPATVFYTLDGTTPDDDSDIAVGQVYLPTDGTILTLKAIAIAGAQESDVLEETWFTDSTDLGRTRMQGKEGVAVLRAGDATVDSISVDQDGNPAQATAVELVELDFIASTTNRIGEKNSQELTSLDFVNFQLDKSVAQTTHVSSPDDINFDPNAQLIVIDGSTQENLDNQIVKIINRPHGTMDVTSPFLQRRPQELDLVSGNFVRTMTNPRTGKIVFYYRESRENRWIKSVQQTQPISQNLTRNVTGIESFVFKWIEDRSMSKIF